TMKSGVEFTSWTDLPGFDSSKVASSTVYDYAGAAYLSATVTLDGAHQTVQSGDVIRSFNKFDATPDNKQLYSFNMKGGVQFTSWSGISGFGSDKVASSTVYDYA